MEALSNKRTLCIILGLIICVGVAIALLPLYRTGVRWENSISYAGSFASLATIIVTLTQVYGLSKATDSIREAVDNNNKVISQLLNVEEITRHLEMTKEIRAYLKDSKWEIVHIRMIELVMLANKLANAPDKFQLDAENIRECLKDFKDDLRNLNMTIQNNSGIDGAIIADHLDNYCPILNTVQTNLKTFQNA